MALYEEQRRLMLGNPGDKFVHSKQVPHSTKHLGAKAARLLEDKVQIIPGVMWRDAKDS